MRVSELSVGLLSYYVGVEYIYAVLLDQQGRTYRFRLESCARTWPKINMLFDVLEQPHLWSASHRSNEVRDFCDGWGISLLPPIDQLRQFQVLIIVPNHFLHGLPLHLVRCAGEPLAISCGVSYCSSGTLLARCAERNRARSFDTSAWTFPWSGDGAAANGPLVSTCLSYGTDVLTGVDPYYNQLARSFAERFPKHVVANSRNHIMNALWLNEKNVDKPDFVRPDAICIVCHAFYNASNPDVSGLLMEGAPILRRPAKVSGKPIFLAGYPFAEIPIHLDPEPPLRPGAIDAEVLATSELRVFCETNAQLIALFGCSTATGIVASCDDFVSHAYQWLKAGCSSVVANLWEADFQIISEWAQRFAVNWVDFRQPKALAAREATRSLLADHPELESQPELWGCVCVLGDWL